MNSKKPTALVASACEPTLQIVHEICASAGLHCKLARNALTAAMFLDETTPDLLCVDVDLQTGNGLKFIEALSLAPELARIPTIGFGDQLSGALKNVKTPFTYFIERPVEKLRAPDYDSIFPGEKFQIAGHKLWVEEKDQATMVGVQGELPLDATPDGVMRYVDLTDNRIKLTIEYFEDDSVELYNLEDDLGEKQNLASRYPDKVEQLRNMLRKWWKSTDARLPTKNPHPSAVQQ